VSSIVSCRESKGLKRVVSVWADDRSQPIENNKLNETCFIFNLIDFAMLNNKTASHLANQAETLRSDIGRGEIKKLSIDHLVNDLLTVHSFGTIF
jgi:hypothetical protein